MSRTKLGLSYLAINILSGRKYTGLLLFNPHFESLFFNMFKRYGLPTGLSTPILPQFILFITQKSLLEFPICKKEQLLMRIVIL